MFEDLPLPGLKLITPVRKGDERGFFCETHNERTWREAGLEYRFVQDNHSFTRTVGTVRGLHFQTPPFAQAKLVRVVAGSILDVVVDLRRSSPTFGRHHAVKLSRENWRQLLIPIGFAHGFATLESDTEVLYKVTDFHHAEHDRGLAWDDPELGIQWPHVDPQTLSQRDRNWPRLTELPEIFA